MGGNLWDGADLLAALAGVDATRAATEVPAGPADQLVRPTSAEQAVIGGSTAEVVGPRAAQEDVLASASDDRVVASLAIQQVRGRSADQPVPARPPGELARLSIDDAADHHGQSGIRVEDVVAATQVADDRADVARGAAHLGCAGLGRFGIVKAAIRSAAIRIPKPLGCGEDEPPIRRGVGGDPVVDAPLVVEGQ